MTRPAQSHAKPAPSRWASARSRDKLWLIYTGNVSRIAADELSDEQADALAERIKARIREGVC